LISPEVPTEQSRGATIGVRAGRVALVVAVLHGLNDAYAAFLHPLLPRIMDRLGLSIALAATLAMTLSLAASLVQPVMGWLADRYGRRLFVVAGPALSGVFLSLIGVAPTFAVLLVCLALGGLGSAAYHPPAASLAARVAEGKGSGARFSVFSFGGAVGYAIGPLAAVGLVSAFGLGRLWFAMLPALIFAVIAYPMLPAGHTERSTVKPPKPTEVLRLLRGPLGLIFGISAIGAFLQRVFLTMQPILVNEAGGSEALGALSLSVYLGGQAVGTLASGTLTDRMDRRTLLAALTLLAVPAHIAAFTMHAGSVPALVVTAIAGSLNMALLPPVVVMAQELVPSGAAFTSGIVMGLAWAVGSVGVLGTGVLGDLAGAQAAALASVPVMLIATGLALALERRTAV
jgi:FSR family fosmidomycin resistance protein-like MFS transporter